MSDSMSSNPYVQQNFRDCYVAKGALGGDTDSCQSFKQGLQDFNKTHTEYGNFDHCKISKVPEKMFENKDCDKGAFRLLTAKGVLHENDCQYLNKEGYFPLGCGRWNDETLGYNRDCYNYDLYGKRKNCK